MRGGQPHDLSPVGEQPQACRAVNYRCRKCGEGYQVRTSAPSCRIQFLEKMEQLQAPYGNLQLAARRALLDVLTRRMFKWPRPSRVAMLDQFERWQAWKAQQSPAEHR
jgi:transposase-like protein